MVADHRSLREASWVSAEMIVLPNQPALMYTIRYVDASLRLGDTYSPKDVEEPALNTAV